MKDVARLNSAFQRLDGTFPAVLSGLVDLAELSKGQTGAKGRLMEIVQRDFQDYLEELTEIIERLEHLNKNLSRLIAAARKIMEDKQIERFT